MADFSGSKEPPEVSASSGDNALFIPVDSGAFHGSGDVTAGEGLRAVGWASVCNDGVAADEPASVVRSSLLPPDRASLGALPAMIDPG